MLPILVFIIFLLIVLNGFFALSELAVVSARKARLRALAEEGARGARRALALAESPGSFLSAVQIGITLVGILAGALGGSVLSHPLAERLAGPGWIGRHAEELAFAVVVALITYVSLIIGELLPKQLALRHAERLACLVAGPMDGLGRVARPLVWVLDTSTRLMLRALRMQPMRQDPVTDEEIRLLVREATEAGVVEAAEQEMIWGVMRLADRPVSGVMTPRPDVEWLDIGADAATLRQRLRETPHARLPVCDGGIDEVLGVVQAKDLLDRCLAGEALDLRAALRELPAVPETTKALAVLELFRRSPVHMALVVDEYGSVMGVVTTSNLTEVVMGALAEAEGMEPEARAVQRDDGSWLLDGGIAVDEAAELLRLPGLAQDGSYHTLAGWLLAAMGRLPQVGEGQEWQGWRFEVVDRDGNRIDKILVLPPQTRAAPDASDH